MTPVPGFVACVPHLPRAVLHNVIIQASESDPIALHRRWPPVESAEPRTPGDARALWLQVGLNTAL